jgi:hypothetical protein
MVMRVEPDFAIAASQCFVLREREQPAAQSRAPARRGNGDVVEEQIIRRREEHDDGGYHSPFLKHPHRALGDARRVVVEHRPRRFAYAGDVVPIGLVHDFRDGRDIGRSRSSDANFVDHQYLPDHLMNERSELAMRWS